MCESGPIRMSFVVDRKVLVDHELCTTAWSKQWRRVWGFVVSKSRPFSFAIGLSDFHEVFDQPNASKKAAVGILCGWKFVWDLRAKQDSKSPCSSKATAWRESHRHSRWIHSGTVNLAKFTLIPPWHIFVCFEMKYVRVNRLCVLCGGLNMVTQQLTMHCHVVRDPFSNLYLLFVYEFSIYSASLGCLLKVIFVSPDMFVCIPHVYMRVLTNGLGPTRKELSKCIIRNRRTCLQLNHGVYRVRVQQLLCLPASFSFRPYRYVYCRLNKACERVKPSRVLFTSCTCADTFTGPLFWFASNDLLFILTFRVLFAICFVFKRLSVSCGHEPIVLNSCPDQWMQTFLWALAVI